NDTEPAPAHVVRDHFRASPNPGLTDTNVPCPARGGPHDDQRDSAKDRLRFGERPPDVLRDPWHWTATRAVAWCLLGNRDLVWTAAAWSCRGSAGRCLRASSSR